MKKAIVIFAMLIMAVGIVAAVDYPTGINYNKKLWTSGEYGWEDPGFWNSGDYLTAYFEQHGYSPDATEGYIEGETVLDDYESKSKDVFGANAKTFFNVDMQSDTVNHPETSPGELLTKTAFDSETYAEHSSVTTSLVSHGKMTASFKTVAFGNIHRESGYKVN